MSFFKHAPALLLGAVLAACGGGGGDTATPAPATNLSQSTAEASQAAQFSVNAAAALATKAALISNNPFFDAPTPGVLRAAAGPSMRRQSAAPQVHALAAFTASCIETEIFTGPCTGSVVIDSDIPATATNYPANSYLSFDFKSLSGPVAGVTLSFNGVMRIDFLSTIDPNIISPANTRYKVTMASFSGSVGSVSFGPESSTILVEYDAQSVPTLTSGDLVLSKITGLNLTDNSNFSIGSVQVRNAYWGNAENKLDASLQNWVVTQARPAVGSVANLTASNGVTAKVEVSASSSASVVYPVQIAIGASTKRYTVTASYASATATPTYTVVEAP